MASDQAQPAGEELWRHSSPQSTKMWEFMQVVNKTHNRDFKTYQDLYEWSVDQIADFWKLVWDFCGVRASKQFDRVVDEAAPMFPRPAFFAGARLNFAENLLFPTQAVDPSSPALIAATETTRATVTWAELRARVAKCQAGLRAIGLREGERVAGLVGNNPSAIVAMLATTSLGGIWTAISPDSGVAMVLDRLRQIGPVCLFADNAQMYNGKTFEVLGKVGEVVKELGSLKKVIVFRAIESCSMDFTPVKAETDTRWVTYEDFTSQAGAAPELTFTQLPPDTPVYILYSSGTTGAPKCIVHGAIGTLIQHKKEHILHCSITPGARLFYYTTCTWMMWHWLVSGLASGATLIIYDGSPMRYRAAATTTDSTAYTSVADDLAMPRLIAELEIEHFGTSAKYLSTLEQKHVLLPTSTAPPNPPLATPLPSLRAIYNTASPLAPSTFRYVYAAFGSDLNLGSITGGTDIISLFGAPSPLVPVHAGEVQCRGLGMAVRAYDDDGADVTAAGQPGDLVCVRAFPCMPVGFWGDGGEERYRASYFARFRAAVTPGHEQAERSWVWHHGDFVVVNPATGGLTMLGRSDGVLNPAGIRFGSAEIYNVLLKYFAPEVEDGLCVGWVRPGGDGDEVVVLFLKMVEGQECGDELVRRIKAKIRESLSARHVPGWIGPCEGIPVTVNGKKIESAVKKIISGSKVKTSASVANVECMEFYEKWADKHNRS